MELRYKIERIGTMLNKNASVHLIEIAAVYIAPQLICKNIITIILKTPPIEQPGELEKCSQRPFVSL